MKTVFKSQPWWSLGRAKEQKSRLILRLAYILKVSKNWAKMNFIRLQKPISFRNSIIAYKMKLDPFLETLTLWHTPNRYSRTFHQKKYLRYLALHFNFLELTTQRWPINRHSNNKGSTISKEKYWNMTLKCKEIPLTARNIEQFPNKVLVNVVYLVSFGIFWRHFLRYLIHYFRVFGLMTFHLTL